MDKRRTEDQEELEDLGDQEQFVVLEAAIEYKLKGVYPEGLTGHQKRSARRKAKSIAVEHGEVFILKKRGRVS